MQIGESLDQWNVSLRQAKCGLIEKLLCQSQIRGYKIFNLSQQVAIEGLTGRIHFEEGKRSDIKLDLLKLHQEKIKKVGFWTPSTGINITKHSVFYGQQSSNVTLIVVTRIVSYANYYYIE